MFISTMGMVIWAVSLGIVVFSALIGLVGGLHRGAYHTAVKLGAHILSVSIALGITLCLRGVIVGPVSDFLIRQFPQWKEYASLIELGAQLPTSVLLLGVFWLIFCIVSALMKIPRNILCKRLSKTFEQAFYAHEKRVQKKAALKIAERAKPAAAEQAEADLTDGESTPIEAEPVPEMAAKVEEIEDVPILNPLWGKVAWYSGAIVGGMLSALLALGVVMMPFSSTLVRLGGSADRITEVILEEKEFLRDQQDEIAIVHELNEKTLLSPLFTVTDFFYGKTVYEPLIDFNTELGRIRLTKELNTATDMTCKLIPVMAPMMAGGADYEVSDQDAKVLADVTKQAAESKFMMTAGSLLARLMADSIAEDKSESESMAVLHNELSVILENMTPEQLAADVETLGELLKALAKSPLLQILADDSGDPTIADLANREMMRDLFGAMYDNDHTKQLFVPVVNVGAEAVFKQMKAEPVYSDADLDQVSRKEMLEEADRLYEALLGLDDFATSMEEGENAATYRMAEAGKALDCMKNSILFGNRYEMLVRTIAQTGSSADNALMDALADALVTSKSAEKLLNSAHSMIVLSDELEKKEAKGSQNEKIVASLDVLLNDTDKADADTLANLAGDAFTTSNATSEQKKQMLEDCSNALAAVSQQGVKDLNVEADAVQVFYDLSNSKEQNPFAEISEEKTVEAMIQSQLAQEMLKDLNAEGRDYGVRESLTAENKTNLKNALHNSTGDAAAKAAVAIFFGID